MTPTTATAASHRRDTTADPTGRGLGILISYASYLRPSGFTKCPLICSCDAAVGETVVQDCRVRPFRRTFPLRANRPGREAPKYPAHCKFLSAFIFRRQAMRNASHHRRPVSLELSCLHCKRQPEHTSMNCPGQQARAILFGELGR